MVILDRWLLVRKQNERKNETKNTNWAWAGGRSLNKGRVNHLVSEIYENNMESIYYR